MVSFFHLRDHIDHTFEPDGIELPNMDAVKRLALAAAFEVLAADIAEGKLNLNLRIVVEDENGVTVHTLPFRDIVEVIGYSSH